jgi:hypothetical protein
VQRGGAAAAPAMLVGGVVTKAHVRAMRDPKRRLDIFKVVPVEYLLDEINHYVMSRSEHWPDRTAPGSTMTAIDEWAMPVIASNLSVAYREHGILSVMNALRSSVPWPLVQPFFVEYLTQPPAPAPGSDELALAPSETRAIDDFFAEYVARPHIRARIEAMRALIGERRATTTMAPLRGTRLATPRQHIQFSEERQRGRAFSVDDLRARSRSALKRLVRGLLIDADPDAMSSEEMIEALMKLHARPTQPMVARGRSHCEVVYEAAPWVNAIVRAFAINTHDVGMLPYASGQHVGEPHGAEWRRANTRFFEWSCRGERRFSPGAVAYVQDDGTLVVETREMYDESARFLRDTTLVTPQSLAIAASFLRDYHVISTRLHVEEIVAQLAEVAATNDDLVQSMERLVSAIYPTISERATFVERFLAGEAPPQYVVDERIEDMLDAPNDVSDERRSEIELAVMITRADVARRFGAALAATADVEVFRRPDILNACESHWLHADWINATSPVVSIVVDRDSAYATPVAVGDTRWRRAKRSWYELACRVGRTFAPNAVGYLLRDGRVINETRAIFDASIRVVRRRWISAIDEARERPIIADEARSGPQGPQRQSRSLHAAQMMLFEHHLIAQSHPNDTPALDAYTRAIIASFSLPSVATNAKLARDLSRVLVYLSPIVQLRDDASGRRTSETIHMTRTRNGQIPADAFISMSDDALLPEVYRNPAVSRDTIDAVRSIIAMRRRVIEHNFYERIAFPSGERLNWLRWKHADRRPAIITRDASSCPANVSDVVYYLDAMDDTMYCFDRAAIVGKIYNPTTGRVFSDAFLAEVAALDAPRAQQPAVAAAVAAAESGEHRVTPLPTRVATELLAPGLFDRLRDRLRAIVPLYCSACNAEVFVTNYQSISAGQRVQFCDSTCMEAYDITM